MSVARPQVQLTMSETHVTLQSAYSLLIEDVAHHAVGLDLVEATTRSAGNNTSRILTTAIVRMTNRCESRALHNASRLYSPMLQKGETLGTVIVSTDLCPQTHQSAEAYISVPAWMVCVANGSCRSSPRIPHTAGQREHEAILLVRNQLAGFALRKSRETKRGKVSE